MVSSIKIKKITDLEAWKQAHVLTLYTYKLTKSFPKEELYILTNQILRAAISITSNIAEGFSRQTKKEKQQFYFMAKGSLPELQNQLILARDLQYISLDAFQQTATQTIVVHKLLNGLLKSSQSHTRYKIPDTKY